MAIDRDRDTAIQEAATALAENGFVVSHEGHWIGQLVISGTTIEVILTLPPDFPCRPPEIRMNPETLPRRIPHVEMDGKLCIIPNTGVLIDSDRPRDIVRDCLARAEVLLQSGISGENEADLIDEFFAYWSPGCDGGTIRSICTPQAPSREICILHYQFAAGGRTAVLACDNSDIGKVWLARASCPCQREDNGWLHVLSTPILPPDFDKRLLTRDLVESVRSHSSDADCQAFKAWLAQHGLPCTVLFSMQPAKSSEPLVFAVTYNQAVGKNRQAALNPSFAIRD